MRAWWLGSLTLFTGVMTVHAQEMEPTWVEMMGRLPWQVVVGLGSVLILGTVAVTVVRRRIKSQPVIEGNEHEIYRRSRELSPDWPIQQQQQQQQNQPPLTSKDIPTLSTEELEAILADTTRSARTMHLEDAAVLEELRRRWALEDDEVSAGEESEPDQPNAIFLDNLRIRRAPSLNADIVGMGTNGDVLVVLGTNEDGGWYKVQYGGIVGWCSATYIDFSGETERLSTKANAPLPLPDEVGDGDVDLYGVSIEEEPEPEEDLINFGDVEPLPAPPSQEEEIRFDDVITFEDPDPAPPPDDMTPEPQDRRRSTGQVAKVNEPGGSGLAEPPHVPSQEDDESVPQWLGGLPGGESEGQPAKPTPAIPSLKTTQFTAYYPREAEVNTKHGLYVYASVAGDDVIAEEVQADVSRFKAELGGEVPVARVAKQTANLPEGVRITVTPESDEIEFEPPSLTKRWRGAWTQFGFDFYPAAEQADETCFVRVAVAVEGIEMAHIKAAIDVIPAKAVDPVPVAAVSLDNPLMAQKLTAQEITPYQKIFVSYSRRDTAVIRAYKMAQVALGNEVFVDVDNLRSGENWQAGLARAIDDADIFQLFWSEHSAGSDYCRYEWEYALAQRCDDLTCEGFIRPVYWEKPMPDVPETLGRLNFKYVPLEGEAETPSEGGGHTYIIRDVRGGNVIIGGEADFHGTHTSYHEEDDDLPSS